MAPLWRDTSFRRLWIALAISDSGSAVGRLALPLTAVLALDAGALEMGALTALQQLPVPLLGLFAGVVLDRVRRRPVMVAADLGRAALLAAIPLLSWQGVLDMGHLYAVALAMGSLTVFFDLAVTSHLPDLVERARLTEANSRLQASTAVVSIAGPGAGGALVQWLGAPLAVGADALSFLASGLAVARIPRPESRAAPAPSSGLWREMGEGWQSLMGNPVLRAITVASMFGACGGAIQQSVLVLFATRELQIAPASLGLAIACGGVGALAGALSAPALSRRFGGGPAIIAGSLVSVLGYALLLAARPGPGALPVVAGAQLLSGAALGVISVNQISIRQALTPARRLGRVNATRRVLVFGTIPAGALAGGLLGEAVGLRAPLLLAALTMAASCLAAGAPPLRRYRGSGHPDHNGLESMGISSK